MVINLEPWLIESQNKAHVGKNRGLEHKVGPDKVPLKNARLGFFVVL
jgi:hypothetical protein